MNDNILSEKESALLLLQTHRQKLLLNKVQFDKLSLNKSKTAPDYLKERIEVESQINYTINNKEIIEVK